MSRPNQFRIRRRCCVFRLRGRMASLTFVRSTTQDDPGPVARVDVSQRDLCCQPDTVHPVSRPSPGEPPHRRILVVGPPAVLGAESTAAGNGGGAPASVGIVRLNLTADQRALISLFRYPQGAPRRRDGLKREDCAHGRPGTGRSPPSAQPWRAPLAPPYRARTNSAQRAVG